MNEIENEENVYIFLMQFVTERNFIDMKESYFTIFSLKYYKTLHVMF